MVYIIVFACVLAYGVWYAMDPLRALRKKYGEDEVPAISVKTARIVGVIIALLGAGGMIYGIVQLVTG